MTQKEVDRWVQRLAKTAWETFVRDGRCPTTALLVVKRVPMAFEAVLGSEDDKGALRALFEVGARGGAEACGLVTEAWAAGGSAKKLAKAIARRQRGESLVNMPGRKELLLVHAVSAVGSAGLQYRIERARNSIRLTSKEPFGKTLFSRFLSDLPWCDHDTLTTTSLETLVEVLGASSRRREPTTSSSVT